MDMLCCEMIRCVIRLLYTAGCRETRIRGRHSLYPNATGGRPIEAVAWAAVVRKQSRKAGHETQPAELLYK
jgi:hypothetical protein